MNDKCKYCDYVSKCSRICEYNSYLCKVHRSFPKVVDKSYEQLQQENKILKENAEHNDKVVDKVNWENMLLKKENEQLKDNWNKLKEYCKENTLCYEVGDDENTKLIGSKIHGLNVLDKMQELEQGSDGNGNN